jgi:hypothetical protein
MALGENELKLLAFLCDAKANNVRVKALKYPATLYIVRLRRAGLVAGDCFLPTPSGITENEDQHRPIASAPVAVAPVEHAPALAAEPKVEHQRPSAPTGPQLAAEIEAFLDANPRISKTKLSFAIFNFGSGIEKVAIRFMPTPETVRRVRDFLDNPPSLEPLYRERAAVRATIRHSGKPAPEPVDIKVNAKSKRDPTTKPPRTASGEKIAFERAAQSRLRANRVEAERRLDAGENPFAQKSVHMKITMARIARTREDEARLGDPVERAKIILRKRYTPVVSAQFADPPGRLGYYVVGRLTLSEAELLALAAETEARGA